MYYAQINNNIELQYRLEKWTDTDNLWYKQGANDAVSFFKSIDGSYDQILITNEWKWLRERFDLLYATQQI
jgi:hypothetical protein